MKITDSTTLAELSDSMQRALIRCHAWQVQVADPAKARIGNNTLLALIRHGLIEQKPDARARPLWKPTDLGARILSSHEPRLLTPAARPRRSERGYTTDPTVAMADEPEAVDEATQERITAGGLRNHGQTQLLRQAQVAQQTLGQRLDRAKAIAKAKGITDSSEVRLIERKVAALERKVGEWAA